MKEKCCSTCYHLEIINLDYLSFKKNYYICNLHNLKNGEVSDPGYQFCGDEHWTSKNRIENLNKLGIKN